VRTIAAVATFAAVAVLAGCAGGPKRGGGGGGPAFHCAGRHATYVVTGSIVATEAGVKLSCDGEVPQVEEYRLLDGGREDRRGGRVSADAFEEAWNAFEQAGWRMVADCKNPRAAKKDPFYVFEIADEEKQISVTCKGKELPYPHDTLRDALDRALSELPVDERAE
jgi:hypothetical protein